jgi:hypothetical protein
MILMLVADDSDDDLLLTRVGHVTRKPKKTCVEAQAWRLDCTYRRLTYQLFNVKRISKMADWWTEVYIINIYILYFYKSYKHTLDHI